VLDGSVPDDIEKLAGFVEGAEPELACDLNASENAPFLGELDVKIAEKLAVGNATHHVAIVLAVDLEISLPNLDGIAVRVHLDAAGNHDRAP